MSTSEDLLEINHLRKNFDVKTDSLTNFVGLQVDDRSTHLFVHQTAYTKRIISRFNMESCKPSPSPCDPNVKLSSFKEEKTDMDFPYRAAIGSLLYLAVGSRPDIAFAVNTLHQYRAEPKAHHVTAVKRILRYLKNTASLGLVYPKGSKRLEVIGYTDSDYAGDIETRKSTSGFIFTINGTAVTWNSSKQRTVALSSTEAEYVAASNAAKEGIWIANLIKETT